ncbi:MAG: hypothetical protein KBB11_03445 [Bacteroidales bacterium]|nr:hypothetical protein [Bacteroidales bacterium]HOY39752.1 hypothetical protein [Bacteroidales bacterium]HQP04350.1 hypothetical protein [Bacteroidales bacterium]
MKSRFFYSIALILFATVLLFSCGKSAKKAAQYNEKIVQEQIKLQDNFNAFEATFADYKKEEMSSKLQEALKQADASLEFFTKLDDFDNQSAYKNAAIEFASMYKRLATNEFPKLVDRYSLPDSLFKADVEIECFNLLQDIDSIYNESFTKLVKAQKEFASTYQFTIEEKK